MVKIIIEGDINAIGKMYLTCKYCGTEFVCHVDDTTLITKEVAKGVNRTIGRFINCPFCNKMNDYSFDKCLEAKEEYLSNYVLSDGKKVYL
jgi:transcription elongation factor Elf1